MEVLVVIEKVAVTKAEVQVLVKTVDRRQRQWKDEGGCS